MIKFAAALKVTNKILHFFNSLLPYHSLYIYIIMQRKASAACSLQAWVGVTVSHSWSESEFEQNTTELVGTSQTAFISRKLKMKVIYASFSVKLWNITMFNFLSVVDSMGSTGLLPLLCVAVVALLSVSVVQAEDAYKYFTWTVTYGTLSPLGSPQQVSNSIFFRWI